MCGFSRIDLDSGKGVSREMCRERPSFVMSEELGRLVELNGAPWNKIFRASILKNMRDLVSPPPVLDDLLLHLLAYLDMKGTVVFTPKSLVNYMVRAGSIINSITKGKVDAATQSFLEVKTYYVEGPCKRAHDTGHRHGGFPAPGRLDGVMTRKLARAPSCVI